MIATLINAAAVVVGSLIGLLLRSKIKDSFKAIVPIGAGVSSLIIGIEMAVKGSQIVFLALSLIIGGLLGTWWCIEEGILALGDTLKRRFARKETGQDFAYAFLNASVLFCVGAMALVGSFKAGVEHDYTLILTKSVMDGFMAIMLSAAMGVGVAFSAAPILAYQGILTLGSVWVAPLVSQTMLNELTSVGGAMVIMIGINLLGLAKLKTANFLPALLLIVLMVAGQELAVARHLFGL
jgi:uncharacterized membrane protein YqgA involved in biofilm formation